MPIPLRMEHAGTEAASEEPAMKNVALVVGSAGIFGAALIDILLHSDNPTGPWKIYALSDRPLPSWSDAATVSCYSSSNSSNNKHNTDANGNGDGNTVVHLHVDLADTAAVTEALAPLTDTTHIFYVTWSARQGWSYDEACAANRAMLSGVLSAVVPNSAGLQHVALQSGRDEFVDPFQPFTGVVDEHVPGPYSEDLPRLIYPDLEDALVDGLAGREGAVTWSAHRPATVFGFAPRSARNLVSSLCVYAAICSKEGAVLRWPGSLVAWEGFSDAIDEQLLAAHALWAATMLDGPNEAFSCANGDVYKWKQLWPMLANHFGVQWAGYEGEDQRFKLEDAMVGKETVWAEIVREMGLMETDLDDITAWWFVDAVINADNEHVETMNKSKEFGFLGFRTTVRCFDSCIRRIKASKIVP